MVQESRANLQGKAKGFKFDHLQRLKNEGRHDHKLLSFKTSLRDVQIAHPKGYNMKLRKKFVKIC